MRNVGVSFTVAAALVSAGCTSLSDDYYAGYSASCSAEGGVARTNLLVIANAMAARMEMSLKILIDDADRTNAVIDLPLLPGVSPYRPGSSGQIVFSRDLTNKEIAVAVIGSLKKDPALVQNIRRTVEEQLTGQGCSPWKFDNARTVFF